MRNWRAIALILGAGWAIGCDSSRPPGPMTFTELGEWEAHRVGDACAWILVGGKQPEAELHRDTIWGDATGFMDWRVWAADLREGDAGWVEWPGNDHWQPTQGPAAMGGRWWIRVERVLPEDPIALAERMVEGVVSEEDWLEAAVRSQARIVPEPRWHQDSADAGWFAQAMPPDSASMWKAGEGIWLDIRSASLDQAVWPRSPQDTTPFPAIQWTFRWGDEGQTLPALRDFLQRRAQPGIYWWAAPALAAQGEDGIPLAGHTPEMPGLYRIEVRRDTTLTPPTPLTASPT